MKPGLNLPKKLRVIYNDPDATDLSSDEEEIDYWKKRKNQIVGTKRVVKEISCSSASHKSCSSNSSHYINDGTGSRRPRRSSSTYSTEEEAAAVYQTKKQEANNAEKTMTQRTMKKVVKEYRNVKEQPCLDQWDEWKDEPSIMELWEVPPSASESWEELFRPYGHEDYLPCGSDAVSCLLLPKNSKDKLFDQPDIKTKMEDMAWADEILNLEFC
ncbi:Uncharacterized protein TCM_043568 [Theobroma cacao]|uniref:Uncharacterized protein n=1 Tax=Theobroma cacao TaxID=3641 RepID=A0A061FPJ1_THECC|nr:Uncharacterized protein TCM_043568 [Theobroma cacao]